MPFPADAVLSQHVRRPGRRSQKHRNSDDRLLRLARTICELDGFEVRDDADLSSLSLDPECVDALRSDVSLFGSPHSAFKSSPHGPPQAKDCLRQLLGSHADYSGDSCTAVPLDMSRLDLPSGSDVAVSAFTHEESSSRFLSKVSASGFCCPTLRAVRG